MGNAINVHNRTKYSMNIYLIGNGRCDYRNKVRAGETFVIDSVPSLSSCRLGCFLCNERYEIISGEHAREISRKSIPIDLWTGSCERSRHGDVDCGEDEIITVLGIGKMVFGRELTDLGRSVVSIVGKVIVNGDEKTVVGDEDAGVIRTMFEEFKVVAEETKWQYCMDVVTSSVMTTRLFEIVGGAKIDYGRWYSSDIEIKEIVEAAAAAAKVS